MAALLSLLERMTKELDLLKKEVATVKDNATAVNRAIVQQRYGDKIIETAGESHSVMQQLAAAPMATNAADDDHRLPDDLRGYVPGAH